jgi:hypothetical protein
MKKSVFESKDTHPTFAVAEENGEQSDKYTGPERRRDDRRANQERRIEVRFELTASDRRENPGGRRQGDVSVKYY